MADPSPSPMLARLTQLPAVLVVGSVLTLINLAGMAASEMHHDQRAGRGHVERQAQSKQIEVLSKQIQALSGKVSACR